jgi:lipopolysaccharide export system ATP-binding protein
MTKLFQAQGLVKYYGGRAVVDHTGFDVERGEAVGMLGPNGAGKTTAFRMCIGLIRPAAGSVCFEGRDVTHLPMHRRSRLGMSYLAQEPSLFQHMRVGDNLTAIMEMQGVDRRTRQAKADEMLAEFGLSHLREHVAYSLSGGERRRLEIARCLCAEPKLILMDEPFTGIDPIAVSEVQDLVVGLKYRGIGVLITDHNVPEALRITDRAYILSEGRIVTRGTPEEILEDPIARESYLGHRIQAVHIGVGEENRPGPAAAPGAPKG